MEKCFSDLFKRFEKQKIIEGYHMNEERLKYVEDNTSIEKQGRRTKC